MNFKHGLCKHPRYQAWWQMHSRCRSPKNKEYKNYGARGISVCVEWNDFSKFWADMGPSCRPGLTLDRKDNDGNYSLDNCRWATYKEQANNTRRNRPPRIRRPTKGRPRIVFIETLDGCKHISQIMQETGWSRSKIWRKYKKKCLTN